MANNNCDFLRLVIKEQHVALEGAWLHWLLVGIEENGAVDHRQAVDQERMEHHRGVVSCPKSACLPYPDLGLSWDLGLASFLLFVNGVLSTQWGGHPTTCQLSSSPLQPLET